MPIHGTLKVKVGDIPGSYGSGSGGGVISGESGLATANLSDGVQVDQSATWDYQYSSPFALFTWTAPTTDTYVLHTGFSSFEGQEIYVWPGGSPIGDPVENEWRMDWDDSNALGLAHNEVGALVTLSATAGATYTIGVTDWEEGNTGPVSLAWQSWDSGKTGWITPPPNQFSGIGFSTNGVHFGKFHLADVGGVADTQSTAQSLMAQDILNTMAAPVSTPENWLTNYNYIVEDTVNEYTGSPSKGVSGDVLAITWSLDGWRTYFDESDLDAPQFVEWEAGQENTLLDLQVSGSASTFSPPIPQGFGFRLYVLNQPLPLDNAAAEPGNALGTFVGDAVSDGTSGSLQFLATSVSTSFLTTASDGKECVGILIAPVHAWSDVSMWDGVNKYSQSQKSASARVVVQRPNYRTFQYTTQGAFTNTYDFTVPDTPASQVWRKAGVTNNEGGTLNVYAKIQQPPIDLGTPSSGVVPGTPQPSVTEWGRVFYTDRMDGSNLSAFVDSGPTSPTTATHTINISPGPSQGDWNLNPLGSEDYLIAALTWRTTNYDRSGTIEIGNPSFDPAVNGPAGFTLIGSTGPIDSTAWTTPRPNSDGIRLAVWFAPYDDISPATDVSVTINAASQFQVRRVRTLPGKPAPTISFVESGTAANAGVREYIFPSNWADTEPYGTMAMFVAGSTQQYSATLPRDMSISSSIVGAGAIGSTYYSSWVGFLIQSPPGTVFDEPVTAAAAPDFMMNLEAVSSTGGITTWDGASLADNDWVIDEWSQEYWYQMSPGSTVTASGWAISPPDGAIGVGVAILAETVSDGDITVTLSGPGISSTAFFPAGTFPALTTFGSEMFLTEPITFYLPDAPAQWIQAYEDNTLSVEITTTGTHRIFGLSLVATYPIGSVFTSDWITPNKDYLIDNLPRRGSLKEGLTARMQPYPPSLNHESIPDLWGGAPPDEVIDIFDNGFRRIVGLSNAAGYFPSGLHYYDKQTIYSLLYYFGFEDDEATVGWWPDYEPGFDGYTRGAVGYEYETGPKVIWDVIGNWDQKNPSHRRWDASYNRLGEHPEVELDPSGELNFTWKIRHDIAGGPTTQWNLRWATNASLTAGDKAADPFNWDEYSPTTHQPTGSLAVLPEPPAVQGANIEESGTMSWALVPNTNTLPGAERTYGLQPATDNFVRPWIDGPVSLFSGDDAWTAMWIDDGEARWGFVRGKYKLIFPSDWNPDGHSDQPYSGGSTVVPTASIGWHTADNHEPPNDGDPWGDNAIENGWGHASWMRPKDEPGEGRTGRLKVTEVGSAFGIGGASNVIGAETLPQLYPPEGPYDSGDPLAGTEFAVVTYNMPGWVPNKNAELSALMQRASVIGLQEALHMKDNFASFPGWTFYIPDIPGDDYSGGVAQPIGFKNSVWSLVNSGYHFLNDTTAIQPAAAGPRLHKSKHIIWVQLQNNATSDIITFGNCHFVPSNHLGGAALALWIQQRDNAISWLNGLTNVVLVGDFNDQPHESTFAPFVSAVADVLTDPAGTRGSRSIDVALSKGVNGISGKALGGFSSDHKPMLAKYS